MWDEEDDMPLLMRATDRYWENRRLYYADFVAPPPVLPYDEGVSEDNLLMRGYDWPEQWFLYEAR